MLYSRELNRSIALIKTCKHKVYMNNLNREQWSITIERVELAESVDAAFEVNVRRTTGVN